MAKASSKIFTHLWYAKEAEEAARFYASVFPDSRVDRVTPLLSESPSGPAGSVKVVVRKPEELAFTENHPSWTHMYMMMMVAQVGFALAYVF